jgi:hypothetical protein
MDQEKNHENGTGTDPFRNPDPFLDADADPKQIRK